MKRLWNYLPLVFVLTLIFATNSWADPTPQARYLVFSEIESNAMKISFMRGGGQNRIVIVRETPFSSSNVPSDGTNFSSGNFPYDYSDNSGGRTIISNGRVVFNSRTDGNYRTMTITGLQAGTTYYFGVFEYNGSGNTTDVNPSITAQNNPRDYPTLPNPPVNLSAYDLTPTSFIAQWGDPAGGHDKYKITIRQNGTPLDGYFQADNGVNTETGIDGLTPNTAYTFEVATVYKCNESEYVSHCVNTYPLNALTGDTNVCQGTCTWYTSHVTGTYYWYTCHLGGCNIAEGDLNDNMARVCWTGCQGQVGDCSISVDITDNCNNTGTLTLPIHVRPAPVATISTNNASICRTNNATLTFNLTTGTAPWNAVYQAITASGMVQNTIIVNTGTTFTMSVSPTITTTYKLLSVTDQFCSSTLNTQATVVVNPQPTATITGNARVCVGSGTNLTFALTGGTAPWSFTYRTTAGMTVNTFTVNVSTGTSFVLNVAPTVTTVYDLLSVNDAFCSNTVTGQVTVTVSPLPQANLTTNTTDICVGGSAALNFTFPTGTAPWTVNYSVITATGTTNQTLNVNTGTSFIMNVTPTVTTTYRLTRIQDAFCSQNLNTQVTVNAHPLPVVNVTVDDNSLCVGEFTFIHFNLTAGTPPWTINFSENNANGTIAHSANIVFGNAYDFQIAPTSTTTLGIITVTDAFGCTATITNTASIIVRALPVATVTAANSAICSGNSTTLTFTLSTGTPPWTGFYDIINSSGTTHTSFTSTAMTYTKSVNPTVNTTYKLTQVGDLYCLNDINSQATVAVNALPMVTISSPPSICNGNSATLTFNLTAGTGPWTINYSANNGTTTTTFSAFVASGLTFTVNVNPTMTTTYSLMSVNDMNCSQTITGSTRITVFPRPNVTINQPAPMCCGSTTNLVFSLTQGTAPWTVNYDIINASGTTHNTLTVNSGTSMTLNIMPLVTTTYMLTSVTDANCSQTLSNSARVVVYPPPNVTISQPNPICAGSSSSITFTLTSGTPPWIINYTVSNGATSNTVNYTVNSGSTYILPVTPTITTTYMLNSVTDANNCQVNLTGSSVVTVRPLPMVTVSQPTTICTGGTSTLTFTLTTGTAPWTLYYNVNNGQATTTFSVTVNSGNTFTLNVTPTATSTYSLTQVSDAYCMSTLNATTKVTVNSIANATISSPSSICSGNSAVLTFNLTVGTAPWTINYSVITSSGTTNNTLAVFSGSTFTMNVTPTVTTTYRLNSVSDANCSQNLSGSTSIIVRPLPNVSGPANTQICNGSSNSLVYSLTSGTAPWTVNYDVITTAGTTHNTFTVSSGTSFTLNVSPVMTSTYRLTSVSDAYCSNNLNVSNVVTVRDIPNAFISGPSSPICNGSSATLTFNISAGVGPFTINYDVINNNGTTHTSVNIPANTFSYQVVVSPTMNTQYKLISITDAYCQQTFSCVCSVTVNVTPLPSATISGNANICNGSNSTITFNLTSGTAPWMAAYQVNNGTTTTSYSFTVNSGNSYSISVMPTTTSTYSLMWVSSQGCMVNQTGQAVINVRPIPVATISSNAAICTGGNSTITFSLTTGTAPWTINYRVFNGTTTTNFTVNVNSGNTFTLNVSPNVTSTYTLVSVADAYCSQNINATTVISVNNQPMATISAPSALCIGNSGTLTFNLTAGTPPWTINYNVTSGTTTNTFSFTVNSGLTYTLSISPTATSTYRLTSVSDANCSGTLTGSTMVVVNPLPNVSAPTSRAICFGSTTTLNYSLTSGTAPWSVNYDIINASGTTHTSFYVPSGNSFSMTVMPTVTSTYMLTSVTDLYCTQSLNALTTVTVNPQPTVTISQPSSICPGGNTNLVFNLTAGTAPWTVTYRLNNGSVTNTYSFTVNSGTAFTMNVSPTVTSTYELITVTDANCTRQVCNSCIFAIVNVNAQPNVTISPSATICSGGSSTITFNLTAGTPPWTLNYSVNNGMNTNTFSFTVNSGTTSTLNVSPTVTSTYRLISVTDASCSQTLSAQSVITVNPVPTVTVSSPATICAGNNTTLTFNLTSGTAPWILRYNTIVGSVTSTFSSTIFSGNTFTLNVSPGATTTYQLVSVTDANCSNTLTGTTRVTVNSLPNVTISSPATICSGSSSTITFNLTSGTAPWTVRYNTISNSITNTFQFTVNSGNTFTMNVSPTATTNYQLVSVTDANCTNTLTGTTMITVNPQPMITISSPSSICAGSNATLTFNLTAGMAPWTVRYNTVVNNVTTTYQFTVNSGNTYTINVSPMATTVYQLVSVTDANCSRTVTSSTMITVNPTPVATLTAASNSICSGSSTMLTFRLTSGTPPWTLNYSANNGTVTSTFSVNIPSGTTYTLNVTPTATTTYSIMSVSDVFCSANQNSQVTVTVNPLPTPQITGNDTICVGATGEVFSTTNHTNCTYQWRLTGGGTITSQVGCTAYVNWTSAGTFNIIVTETSQFGCSVNDTMSVVVVNAPNQIAINPISDPQTSHVAFDIVVVTKYNGTPTPACTNIPFTLTVAQGTGCLFEGEYGNESYTYTHGTIYAGSSSATVHVMYQKTSGEYDVKLQANASGLTSIASNAFDVRAIEPTTQARGIYWITWGPDSIRFGWTNGNGARRLVLMRDTSFIDDAPSDGNAYSVNSYIGSSKVLYNNTGDSVLTARGLNRGTRYSFRIFEYNGTADLTNYNTSTQTNNPRTRATSPKDGIMADDEGMPMKGAPTLSLGNIAPNPARDKISFPLFLGQDSRVTISLYSSDGRLVLQPYNDYNFRAGETPIDIPFANIAAGTYMMTVTSGNEIVVQEVVIMP